MFFKNKQQDIHSKQLNDQLHSLNKTLSAVNRRLDSMDEASRQMGSGMNQKIDVLDSDMHQSFSSFHSIIQKHDMALEDLLDEWEERQSDNQAVQNQIQELEQNEVRLLELIDAFQEQFWSLKRFANTSQDATLSAQVELMEQALERSRLQCNVHTISECGVDVNYSLHEIVEAIDTDDPSLDKKIADIYRCGYIYKGAVKKKAQAAAYRLKKQ